jgi:hypothetical protein
MFSMIRLPRGLWRPSRRRGNSLQRRPQRRREFNSLMWLCGWGGVTAVALLVFAMPVRLTLPVNACGASSPPVSRPPPRVTQLESDTQLLTAQVRALVTERDRLSDRIALLESSIDDMSGAIKKQAAATSAVLAAKENPPAPSPKTQAASASLIADKEATASIPPNPLPRGDFAPSVVPMPPARIANASAVENNHRRKSKQSSASTWPAERR